MIFLKERRKLRFGYILIFLCLLCPKLSSANPPTTVVTAIFGTTQSVSQVGLIERWSVYPVPKFRERNLEQGIGVRFLDSKRALVNFYSSAWEQTTIIGHKDNSRLYCFNKKATYVIPVAHVFDILSEEALSCREEEKMEYWYAYMTIFVHKNKDKFDSELYPLGFEVSLTRIMQRLAEKGVLQDSGEADSSDEDEVEVYKDRSLALDKEQERHEERTMK